jgi:heptosyltransferase-2
MLQSEIENLKSKILVMHTGGWIGDMILLTPALRALRKELPEAHISMLVRPLVRDLMERNPYLHEVIVYDKRGEHKGIRQIWKMADRLDAKQFDTAIILHPNSIRSALLSYMAGIPERVGANVRGREFLLTAKVKRRANIHEVQRYLDVVSPVVGADHDGKLEFWGIGRNDDAFADRIRADRSGPVIGINPCTTWPSKQWPAERFARLADLLSRRFSARVLITGGPDDFHPGGKIMRLASSKPVNLIGRTTIWQLGALIKRCRLYITCDSGPMHISAAVDTPTLALFGPTDPVRHGPYGAGHTVVRKEMRCSPCYQRECRSRDCMNAIQVEDIMKAVESRLLE